MKTIAKKAKASLGQLLLPFARNYIRYSPINIGKEKLWKAFHWRNKNYTCSTQFNFKMNGHSNDLVQGYIYYFGIWEPNLTSYIQSALVNSKDIFIDIGANVGYFSLLASTTAPEGKIIAIEAFPSTYKKLENNIKLNQLTNIKSINYAVSDHEEELNFYNYNPENEGSTTCKPTLNDSTTTPIPVKAKPLGSIITPHEIHKVRLIKIDVEGHEYEVLKGIFPLLDQFPENIEFIIEIDPSKIDKKRLLEIFTKFESHGFIRYELENNYSPEFYIDFKKSGLPEPTQEIPTKIVDNLFTRKKLSH